jgi:hypothetical protein
MMFQDRSRRLARALAATAAAAALAAPPALARIDPPATPAYNSREAGPTSQSAPVVVRTIDDGFDWGAAAIGAGGAGAVVALAALAAFANTSRDRTRAAP